MSQEIETFLYFTEYQLDFSQKKTQYIFDVFVSESSHINIL